MGKNSFIKTPFPDFKDVEKTSNEEAGREIKQLREAIEYHNYSSNCITSTGQFSAASLILSS